MMNRIKSSILTGLAAVVVIVTAPAFSLARQTQDPAQDPAKKEKQAAEPAPAAAATPEPASSKPRTTTPPSSTHPPTHGRFVGEHWTPYEPPSVESFPQGSKVHIIEKGDTLWDLAAKNLDNPYLWPQIWDVNQYITDSHWIYPGDPILIPGKPTVIGEKGPEPAIELLEPPATPSQPVTTGEPTQRQAENAPATALTPAGPQLYPAAGESDVYCSNYIVDRFDEPALKIHEREDASHTILGVGDIVFLNQGLGSNLSAGDEFTVLLDEGVVPHPIFAEDVGESIRMVGRVRVIALQESTATAEIVHACDAIEVGMPLVPFEEIPVPLTTPAAFRRYGVEMQTENAGYIVNISPDKANIGEGDIVNIDLGSDNGLRPGDVLTIFREWGGVVKYDSPDSYIEGAQARAEKGRAKGSLQPGNFAQSILGQVVVLRTEKHTATAKVILSAREAALGDRVAVR